MAFDIFLLLVILGSMFRGLQQGAIRQLFNIFAIVFGLVVASTYQPTFARFYEEYVGNTNDFVRNTLMWVLLVILVWVIVTVAVHFAFRNTKLKFGNTIDQLFGLMLGLVTGIVLAMVITITIGFTTRVPWPQYDSLREGMAYLYKTSFVKPIMLNFIPTFTSGIKFLVPGGNLPAILIYNLD